MGLGLAVSRAILQAHAGRVWVEPATESCTTFCIALPLS
jgi:signal transduction histidine kinase